MIAYDPASISPTYVTLHLYAVYEVQPQVSRKRKAESEHCVQCSHHGHPEVDSTRPPRLTTPIALFNAASKAPEPNSINAIIREHCRHRLYVQPALWTPKQPELLGCKFVSKTIPPGRRCKKTKPAELVDVDFLSLPKEPGAIYGHAVRAATQLRKSCTLEATDSAVRQLLAACKFEYLG